MLLLISLFYVKIIMGKKIMERLDLSIISDKERSRLFLNYLDVFFQDFRKKSFGSSYFEGNSYFNETSITGEIDGQEDSLFIRISS
ncbi:hypothetical protein CGK30_24440, partial [Vibrio parahaemolyticus]